MQPSSLASENSSKYSIRGRQKAHCGSSSPGVYEFTSLRTTTSNKHRERAGRSCSIAAPNGAKRGIEEQTRKLFEVCRLRDVPIITFVNKLDRESRDPFDLLSTPCHGAEGQGTNDVYFPR